MKKLELSCNYFNVSAKNGDEINNLFNLISTNTAFKVEASSFIYQSQRSS